MAEPPKKRGGGSISKFLLAYVNAASGEGAAPTASRTPRAREAAGGSSAPPSAGADRAAPSAEEAVSAGGSSAGEPGPPEGRAEESPSVRRTRFELRRGVDGERETERGAEAERSEGAKEGAGEPGIDFAGSLDGEDGSASDGLGGGRSEEEDEGFHDEADFDAGSAIAGEERHDCEAEALDWTSDGSAADEARGGLSDEAPNGLSDETREGESFGVARADEDEGELEKESSADDGDLRGKMEASFDTASTADVTFQTRGEDDDRPPPSSDGNGHFEPASPETDQAASGPKSRFSRSFSKAKLRFQKRKHLGKSSSNGDIDRACCSESNVQEKSDDDEKPDEDKGEEERVDEEPSRPVLEEGGVDIVENGSEHNPDITGEEDDDDADSRNVATEDSLCSAAEEGEVCSGSDSGICGATSEAGRSYETEDEEEDDGVGSTSKFNFYTSTSINVYDEEKKEANSFDEDGDKVPAAPAAKRFSFYSSTPLQNTSKHLSDEDLVNSSFLAEESHTGEEEEEEEAGSVDEKVGLYKSSALNIESFDGSDAFVVDDIKSDSVANNDTEELEVNKGMDIEVKSGNGEYDDQILNEPTAFHDDVSFGDSNASYTIGLKPGWDGNVDTVPSLDDCSSRSFVSFREKKTPHSVHKPPSITATPDCDEIEIKKADSESPTTVIDSLHSKTVNASHGSPLMMKYQIGRSLDVTASTLANHTKASATMFTKQDISSITPLQIAHYLTLEERKSVGTKVLSEKMMRGYTIAVSTEANAGSGTVCKVCDMPMLCKQNKNLGACAICPVLKKKVLKRILNAANADPSEGTLVPTEEVVSLSEARKAILDVSKRQSYYDRMKNEEGGSSAKLEWYVEGRNAVAHARDVLANRFNPNESPKKEPAAAEHGITLSPRILFPDDCSVEVVQNDENLCVPALPKLKQIQQVEPPAPSVPPSPKGRPPRSPATPVAVKATPKVISSHTLQCSVTSIAASRRSRNTAVSSLGSQSHQQTKVKASSQSLATQCSSRAHTIASSAISAIQIQIEDTKHKLMHAQDPQKQILYANLLTKLNGALLAVKKLEEISLP